MVINLRFLFCLFFSNFCIYEKSDNPTYSGLLAKLENCIVSGANYVVVVGEGIIDRFNGKLDRLQFENDQKKFFNKFYESAKGICNESKESEIESIPFLYREKLPLYLQGLPYSGFYIPIAYLVFRVHKVPLMLVGLCFAWGYWHNVREEKNTKQNN